MEVLTAILTSAYATATALIGLVWYLGSEESDNYFDSLCVGAMWPWIVGMVIAVLLRERL